jgi:hypothetical protein
MPAVTFADVRKIVMTLEGVTDATAYGAPCFKLNGRIFTCMAINKQAEPNSLMVRLPIDQRNAMVEEEPDVYYVKPHYEPHPCLLVRLSKVRREALRDLLTGAWRQMAAETKTRPRASKKRRPVS